MSSTTPDRAGRREWVALAVLALPALLVSIDVFVVLLALPRIAESLGATSTEQLWILDSYGFLLAGFMLTMGTVGDRVGRRRLLLIGAAGFAAASVLAAFAPTPLALIVARGLLGVAGATLAPSTLALISNLFRDPAQRAQAIGVWMVCFMGGAVIGPIVGGAVLQHFWWGAVFLLGVPAMVLLLVVGPRLLPEFRDASAGRVDLRSVALCLLAVLPAIYGLKELARGGWQAVPALALLAGAAFAVTFVRRQRRLAEPLLDITLFRNRAFTAAVAGMHLITVTGALMLFLTQYFQVVLGRDPLQAGVLMLPAAIAGTVGFVVAPVLARHIRRSSLIAGGMALAAIGAALLTRADVGSGPALAVVAFAILNLGCAPMVTLGTDIVVGSVPPERAGSAAATSETSAELGYALGIAVLGSLGAAVYRHTLVVPDGVPATDVPVVAESVTGATAAATSLPTELAAQVLEAARTAFLTGMDVVGAVCAALLLLVGVLALTALRQIPEAAGEAATGPDDLDARPEPVGSDERATAAGGSR